MSVYLGNNEVGIGVYEKPPQKPYTGFYIGNDFNYNGVRVKLTGHGSTRPPVSLLYSMDNGTTWQNYTNDTWISLGNGERVCFMAGPNGNARFGGGDIFNSTGSGWRFVSENQRLVALHGNVMSLLTQDYENADTVPEYGLESIFSAQGDRFCFYYGETDPLILPAKNVGYGGYAHMFQDQRNLYKVPKVSADNLSNLACYLMFAGTGVQDMSDVVICNKSTNSALVAMFASCYYLEKPPTVVVGSQTNCGEMFTNCYDIKYLNLVNYDNSQSDNSPVDGCKELRYIELGELSKSIDLGNNPQPNGVVAANTDFQGVYPSQYMPNGWTYVCKTTGEVLTPPEN